MDTNIYAVIFSSIRNKADDNQYSEISKKMADLASQQPGYLGIESARGSDGFGITVSYWSSLESIKAWKSNSEHLIAQDLGRTRWYESYKVRICKIEREYEMKLT